MRFYFHRLDFSEEKFCLEAIEIIFRARVDVARPLVERVELDVLRRDVVHADAEEALVQPAPVCDGRPRQRRLITIICDDVIRAGVLELRFLVLDFASNG